MLDSRGEHGEDDVYTQHTPHAMRVWSHDHVNDMSDEEDCTEEKIRGGNDGVARWFA